MGALRFQPLVLNLLVIDCQEATADQGVPGILHVEERGKGYSWTGYTFPKSVPTDFLALRSPLDKLIEQGDY